MSLQFHWVFYRTEFCIYLPGLYMRSMFVCVFVCVYLTLTVNCKNIARILISHASWKSCLYEDLIYVNPKKMIE